jgi:serine/threonine protein kinase
MGGVPELAPGEVFAGRYAVRRQLGEGDRKRTYLARDIKMDRFVALSLVKPEAVLSDPEGTVREAQVLGRIGSHPNIVSLYDYEIGKDGSAQYMVFQYLGGGTLAEHMRAAGPLPAADVLRLGRHLCRGLAHLHASGIIHRDVSPENVWLDERHVAHLGDFDSAITAGSDDGLRPITTGSFAAPEEHEGGVLDKRSDLFSLGGLLYVMATGALRPGDAGLLRSRRDLPSEFGDLVESLLARAPEDRPADAESVLRQLDWIRHASDIDGLIAAGESDRAEFKSSIHHQYGPVPLDLQRQLELQRLQPGQVRKEVQKRLRTSVTKTIAAFLNTDGGTLLIGVADSGAVLGIEADFPYLKAGKQDADGWLLSLKDVIINALGPEVWNAIHLSLLRRGSVTVAVVSCPAWVSETWHRDASTEYFYIRASNATEELNGSSLLRYVRERWPA